MNFWAFSFLLSNLIWSLLFNFSLLKVYFGLITIYLTFGFFIGLRAKNSFRRKMQISTWDDSGDPCLYARFEIDMAPVEKFLEDYNKINPENKISLTLVFTKAIAMGLSASRENFGKLAFGNYVPADSMDIAFLVDVQGENLANALLKNVDKHSLRELNFQLKSHVKEFKTGKNKQLNTQINLLQYIPSFFVQLLLRFGSFMSYDFGISFPLGDLKANNFGYGVVTNITSFDINDSFAPLVPFLKTAFVATMNTPVLKAVVVNNEIVTRKIMNLNFTYDHRFVDMCDLGVISKTFESVLKNPEVLLKEDAQ